MKKCNFSAVFLIANCTLFIFFSQKSFAQNPKPKVNFLGLYIPRGLTKTTDSLAEGYVMFSPPISASVYLMDRKGEVVHEWKGNYL